MEKLTYELLSFRIFNHVFYCVRFSKIPRKCRYCICFFVDDIGFSCYLNEHFTLKKSDFKNTYIEYLSDQVKAGKFTQNLDYVVVDFLNHDPKNKNFTVPFLKTVNNSFMLSLIYIDVFEGISNNANIFTDLLLYNYFLKEKKNPQKLKT